MLAPDSWGVMSERPRKATQLTLDLKERDYRALDEIARARDASISWVIRQLSATSSGRLLWPSPPGTLPEGDQ
jgi:hypothetical protein